MIEAWTPSFLIAIALVAAVVGLRSAVRWVIRLATHAAGHVPRRVRSSRWAPAARRRWEAFADRFPGTARVLSARVEAGRFRGLPLTTIVVGGAMLVLLFSEIAEEVLEEDLLAFDQGVLDALEPYRVAPFVQGFAWITHLGDNAALAIAVLVGVGFVWSARRRDLLLGVAVTVTGSQVMLWVSKFGFDRARPEFLTEVTAASPSFPSGHATGAMAVYGILAYAMARQSGAPGRRYEIAFWAGVLIALVGFSRIYLHVHYPTDVAAGYLTGGLWLLGGIAAAEWSRRTRH